MNYLTEFDLCIMYLSLYVQYKDFLKKNFFLNYYYSRNLVKYLDTLGIKKTNNGTVKKTVLLSYSNMYLDCQVKILKLDLYTHFNICKQIIL